VRERRCHEAHIRAGKADALRICPHAGQQRVGGLHHALGLTRGARGVEQLDHVVRVRPAAGELGGGVEIVLPAPLDQRALEAVVALPAHHQHAFERRQRAAQVGQHGGVVVATEAARHHHEARLGEVEHEAEFALAKDRHQRVADGADAKARQVQRDELPPVRQLERHHVARLHAKADQPQRDAVDAQLELQV
jgi:hypothetical protein